MGRRTKARECALQILYQCDVTGQDVESAIRSFWRVRRATDGVREMAVRLARGARRERERLDREIAAAARHWRLDRMAAIERNLLRLAAYELIMEPATPAPVVIDEAVEIAKRFGESESPAFVNGVLDGIRSNQREKGVVAEEQQPPEPGGGERRPPIEGWPEESALRLERAEALRARGVPIYPNRFARSHRLAEVRAAWDEKSGEELEAEKPEVTVSGRVLLLRGHGRLSFATISDGSASLQLFVSRRELGEDGYALFGQLDRGDYVGVAGRVMRTKKGELSVLVRRLELLSKALLPPPEKWHGLADVELRYRQRYVDLMVNPEVRRVFERRGAMIRAMRRFLDERGYLEVETPMMQPVAGGAMARPFVTHHNALDIDLYLRIAPELYLKRLVVGGLERVYEINRNFRNEGLSSQHNPEFTMLEFYTACFDCDDVIATTEQLVAAAMGTEPLSYQGRELSFALPLPRRPMKQAIAEEAAAQGIELPRELLDDPSALADWTAEPGRRAASGTPLWGERYRSLSHGKRVMQLFEDVVEGGLWQPTFVTDYPVEVSPLSKRRPDDPSVTERFELYAAGMEIANGFSELNDPLEQRQRFLDQLAQRAQGDDEAHQMDEDYVRALGHGLPPTGGCGVGVDRLAMILTDSPSIRDVILFPHMRPETGRARDEDGAG